MYDMTHSHVWHDSQWSELAGADKYLESDMTHSHMWRDSFPCIPRLIHMCDMTHSHVWRDSFPCIPRLIHMCDMTHSHVRHHPQWSELAGAGTYLERDAGSYVIYYWSDGYMYSWYYFDVWWSESLELPSVTFVNSLAGKGLFSWIWVSFHEYGSLFINMGLFSSIWVSFLLHESFHQYRSLFIYMSLFWLIWAIMSVTGWSRPIGCLISYITFRKLATNYRALLRKMIYTDKAPYESSPSCNSRVAVARCMHMCDVTRSYVCGKLHSYVWIVSMGVTGDILMWGHRMWGDEKRPALMKRDPYWW